jgi:multidrug efflux system membrane fusion protein
MSSAQLSEQEPHAVVPASNAPKTLNEPEHPKGSIGRTILIVVVLLAVVGAAVWKIRSNTQDQATQGAKLAAAGDRPIPVQTAVVEKKTMPIYMTALGTVTAYNTVTIKTRVDGQLMRVNVREGQAVKQGEMLVEIDPKPYQAALAQAQGQLTKDQATADNAQAQAARYSALLQAGVVSKETEQGQVSAAGQANGALDADRAAIEAAKVNLGYTKIASPINGVVGLRQVDAGNIVHASDATGLLVVTQLQPIAVIFTLPEDQLPQVLGLIRQGKKLSVDAYDRSNANHLATGSLLTLDNQIDTTTGTAKLKAVFDNKDGVLFPNQFVNIRLILEQMQNAVVVPVAALQSGTQGNFVYVVKPGMPPANLRAANSGGGGKGRKAGGSGAAAGTGAATGTSTEPSASKQPPFYVESQAVTVNVTEGAQVILTDGVNPGDQVVVDGQERLKNGSRVSPRSAATGARKAGQADGAAKDAAPEDVNGKSQQGLDTKRTKKGQRP